MQSRTSRPRSGFGLIDLLVVIAIASFLVAFLLPFLRLTRERAIRTESTNNLKNIGMLAITYHDAWKYLPFNGTGVAKPRDQNSGSWGSQIDVYNSDGAGYRVYPDPFMCPGRGRPPKEATNGGGEWSDYFYNNYLNNPKQAEKPNNPNARRTLASIAAADGTASTVFVGHGNIDTRQYKAIADVTLCCNINLGGTTGTMRSGKNGAKLPAGVTLQRDSATAPGIGSWGGPMHEGALMCMCDATVRLFPYTTEDFNRFLTPDGDD